MTSNSMRIVSFVSAQFQLTARGLGSGSSPTHLLCPKEECQLFIGSRQNEEPSPQVWFWNETQLLPEILSAKIRTQRRRQVLLFACFKLSYLESAYSVLGILLYLTPQF